MALVEDIQEQIDRDIAYQRASKCFLLLRLGYAFEQACLKSEIISKLTGPYRDLSDPQQIAEQISEATKINLCEYVADRLFTQQPQRWEDFQGSKRYTDIVEKLNFAGLEDEGKIKKYFADREREVEAILHEGGKDISALADSFLKYQCLNYQAVSAVLGGIGLSNDRALEYILQRSR